MSNSKKILALITGASRGIGREIALQLAADAAPQSEIIITARNEQQLRVVEQEMLERNGNIHVRAIVCDFAVWTEEIENSFHDALKEATGNAQYDKFFLFHNAGSVGNIAQDSLHLNEWNDYLQLNFVSMVLLNNLVLKLVLPTVSRKRIVVNITSICALKAFSSLTQYSCGKAIREAYFRSLALEHPEFEVLNYSPGPVATEMHKKVAENSFDAEIRAMFSPASTTSTELHKDVLTPPETVKKMMRILSEGKFESGSRVDYFDIE